MESKARDIVGWYTLAAGATGAFPVPATSAAIVANNGFMLAHIGSTMGKPVGWEGVLSSLGIAGTLNIAGRNVFIEAAKALGWGTGSIWAFAALSAVGATTAALQTYVIGLIAIEICKNGGTPISPAAARQVLDSAKESLDAFVSEMRKKDLNDPGAIQVEDARLVQRVLDAVISRTGKRPGAVSGRPSLVRHPKGEDRWAIRVEWIDDAPSEYELVGQPNDVESPSELAERLDEAVWKPFPKPGTWSKRSA